MSLRNQGISCSWTFVRLCISFKFSLVVYKISDYIKHLVISHAFYFFATAGPDGIIENADRKVEGKFQSLFTPARACCVLSGNTVRLSQPAQTHLLRAVSPSKCWAKNTQKTSQLSVTRPLTACICTMKGRKLMCS